METTIEKRQLKKLDINIVESWDEIDSKCPFDNTDLEIEQVTVEDEEDEYYIELGYCEDCEKYYVEEFELEWFISEHPELSGLEDKINRKERVKLRKKIDSLDLMLGGVHVVDKLNDNSKCPIDKWPLKFNEYIIDDEQDSYCPKMGYCDICNKYFIDVPEVSQLLEDQPLLEDVFENDFDEDIEGLKATKLIDECDLNYQGIYVVESLTKDNSNCPIHGKSLEINRYLVDDYCECYILELGYCFDCDKYFISRSKKNRLLSERPWVDWNFLSIANSELKNGKRIKGTTLYQRADHYDRNFKKVGSSRESFFDGETIHYDEKGKKTGSSRDAFFGPGINHYDEKGKKIGSSRESIFGGETIHYDEKGRKTGSSRDAFFGTEINHYDVKGKKIGSSMESACYIATCVYGSYDCPEVWTLRRFRDEYLCKSVFGRLFVIVYYRISPVLVKYCGGFNWFKKSWKSLLDRIVFILLDKGYSNLPYDK